MLEPSILLGVEKFLNEALLNLFLLAALTIKISPAVLHLRSQHDRHTLPTAFTLLARVTVPGNHPFLQSLAVTDRTGLFR